MVTINLYFRLNRDLRYYEQILATDARINFLFVNSWREKS